MFVLLSGRVRVTRREDWARASGDRGGPGQYLAKSAAIGQACIGRWSRDRRCGTILIAPERLRALLVAEAELGDASCAR